MPKIGNIYLTQLKPEHLQKYYSDRLSHGRWDGKGGLSPRSVRHHHMTLHSALQNAVRWGLIQRNPADTVDPPRCSRSEIHTLDEDGVQAFLEVAKHTLYYPIFYLAIYSGMRRSELLALRWEDVDLIFSQVYVNRSLHHLRDGSFVFPAAQDAERTSDGSSFIIDCSRS